MDLNKKALVEVAKSFGRFIYFGLLGLVSTFLVSLAADPSLASSTVTVGGFKMSVGVLLIAGISGLVKLIDRYRHSDPTNASKGIAPSFLQK